MMANLIPGFSPSNTKSTLKRLEKRWINEKDEDLIENRFAEIEEAEKRKKEKLAKYLTAEELCRQSGLNLDELEKLNEIRLLVPDTKDGKYRSRLVGWGKKLRTKIQSGSSYHQIKEWSKSRWN